MTALIASVVEAYGELRVSRGRILLSLMGVAFSVFALTVVLGAGGMLSSALQQSAETWSGRPTVLTLQPMGDASGSVSAEQQDAAVLAELDRMDIGQRSRLIQMTLGIQTGEGVKPLEVRAVDPAYGDMYRQKPMQGRWLADSDQKRLAPALVVNDLAYEQLGRPALGTQTVDLYNGGERSQAVVIGVMAPSPDDWGPAAFMAAGGVDALPGPTGSDSMMTSYVAWVPPEDARTIAGILTQRLSATPAGSFDIYDDGGMGGFEGFDVLTKGVLAVAGVILLLGAMGLLNISLVTVRYRVREIGIRRSYGATGLRIFIGVLMESVVATVIAGAIGVAAAVALVQSSPVQHEFAELGLVDLPPFPVTAVLAGLGTATAVGILAGALPALIATRIKVIDAIRS